MAANPFTYSRAIVCGIPDSLLAAALRMDSGGEPVDLEKARQQHEEFCRWTTGTWSKLILVVDAACSLTSEVLPHFFLLQKWNICTPTISWLEHIPEET